MNNETDSSQTGAVESSVESAYLVLAQAVEESRDGLRWPTASQVRLAMKRLTYGGFNQKDFGFKRFRDFLSAAESAGRVTLQTDHPGDIVVVSAGATGHRQDARRPRIRRDLWKAALDWNLSIEHFLDLEEDRCLSLPTEPALLEPARFQDVRKRIEDGDQALVRVPRVDIQTQVQWMHMFTEGQDDGPLKLLLSGALAGEKPAKHFAAVLRSQPAAQDQWFDILAVNVSAILQAWKEANGLLSELRLEPVSQQTGAEAAAAAEQRASQASASALVDVAGSILASNARASRATNDEEHLRALLHRAIDQMPESELRAIRIPVGYLLGE